MGLARVDPVFEGIDLDRIPGTPLEQFLHHVRALD
jgi:hypothetical protein